MQRPEPFVSHTTDPGPAQAPTGGAIALPCPESQLLSLVDEPWRHALMELERERWEWEAAQPDRPHGKRAYASRRAASLSRPIGPRIGDCGTKGVSVKCACPGRGRFRAYGCRQWWLCGRCRAERAPRLGRRVREALAARMAEAIDTWKGACYGWSADSERRRRDARPRFVMLTLTVRHSGDLASDRDAIARGWRKLYLRLNREIGKFHYGMVWEVTPSDGGHVHAHVAVIWPWIDFGEVRKWWRNACPESERINFSWRRKDRKPSTPSSIANYLGKYLGKGCDSAAFTPIIRAEVSAAMYGKRSVTPSRGFWVPFVPLCKCCGEGWHVVDHRLWNGEASASPVDPYPEEWCADITAWEQSAFVIDTEPWQSAHGARKAPG